MTVQSLTLQLPEPIFRYLQQTAAATRRPLEQVARQSIEGNLPPSVTDMPIEIQDELLAMQGLSYDELGRIAVSQGDLDRQARHQQLLERNSAGSITAREREELAALRLAADRLMLRKAYAWAVLRWRGHPTPALHELPLE
ncbi:MAG: hypothetical protein FJ011_04360 [Chloroflexi bacterium]|nr:hypothetical protein [Chloroflexota bacterium]